MLLSTFPSRPVDLDTEIETMKFSSLIRTKYLVDPRKERLQKKEDLENFSSKTSWKVLHSFFLEQMFNTFVCEFSLALSPRLLKRSLNPFLCEFIFN